MTVHGYTIIMLQTNQPARDTTTNGILNVHGPCQFLLKNNEHLSLLAITYGKFVSKQIRRDN
jgi:hypothetical protein